MSFITDYDYDSVWTNRCFWTNHIIDSFVPIHCTDSCLQKLTKHIVRERTELWMCKNDFWPKKTEVSQTCSYLYFGKSQAPQVGGCIKKKNHRAAVVICKKRLNALSVIHRIVWASEWFNRLSRIALNTQVESPTGLTMPIREWIFWWTDWKVSNHWYESKFR